MGILAEAGMAIDSKAFDIWRRLYTRFGLEPGPVVGSAPEVATSIIPVTQVDDLLRTATLQVSASTDLSGGGGGTLPMLTVPPGERWRMMHLFRTSTVGSSRVFVTDAGGVEVNLTAAGTAEEIVNPGEALVLDEGWSLGMGETGNGADTAEFLQALTTVEQAF